MTSTSSDTMACHRSCSEGHVLIRLKASDSSWLGNRNYPRALITCPSLQDGRRRSPSIVRCQSPPLGWVPGQPFRGGK